MSRSRYTDEERRHSDRLATGAFVAAPRSSRRVASSTPRAGSTRRTHSGRSDLRCGNKRKHMRVGPRRASGLVGQVAALIGAAGHARTAARNRRNDRGIGHHSRAGVHSSTAPAFVRSTRRFRHRARLHRRAGYHRHRGRPFCYRRAALRVMQQVRGRRGRVVGCGSIGRPYNPRLHLTAPRAFFHSACGERV